VWGLKKIQDFGFKIQKGNKFMVYGSGGHHKLRIFFFLAGMLFLATRLCTAAGLVPFKPGEKLQYSIYLADFPAGDVTLAVMPMATTNNIPAYHFLMTAETSPLLDAILMLGDRVESYADKGMTHGLLYKEHKNGAAQQDVTVTFDWKKCEAQYCHGEKKYKPTALVPGAFDPLSVLYALRLLDLKGMRKISKPVSNGLHCAVASATVLGKQKVQVESGEYDTYVVQLMLGDFSDIFKTATVKLWVSSDARRLPVRIDCEFPVGRIMAELKAPPARI